MRKIKVVSLPTGDIIHEGAAGCPARCAAIALRANMRELGPGQELLDLPSNQDSKHVKESAASAQDEDDLLKQNLTQKLFGPTPTILEDEDDLRKEDLTQRLFGRQEPGEGHESSSAAAGSIRSHAVDNPMEDELDTNRKNMTERLFGNTASEFHAQQQPSPEQHQSVHKYTDLFLCVEI